MRPLIIVSLLTLLLAACGQTGSLYLAKDAPKPAATQTSEPQNPQPENPVETSIDQPAATDQPAAEVDTQAR
jgi:predicted small lipoprotein YifL